MYAYAALEQAERQYHKGGNILGRIIYEQYSS